MEVWIARLCVLTEDLRLEWHCVSHESISTETKVDADVRRLYFLRRTVATLVEFAEVLRLLEDDPDFKKQVVSTFNETARKQWSEGIGFFKSEETFLKRVRNDVGGHFGTSAAKYAVQNLNENDYGKMEIIEANTGGLQERLHFTATIAAKALFRHVEGNTDEEKVKSLFDRVREATKHAWQCAHWITFWLWESRFR
jgi:hypothetical protein